MYFLSLLHFITFVIQTYLFASVLVKNHKTSLNRACAALLFSFAVWSAGLIIAHNPAVTHDAALLFYNVSAIGWTSFSSFFLLFPSVFLVMQWKGLLIVNVTRIYYGWTTVWSSSLWPYLFYAYYLSYMVTGILLLLHCGKITESPNKKKQATIIIKTMIPAVFFGTVTSVILPKLSIRIIPNLADIFGLYWSFGMVYATVKYKFLDVTPAMAADNIINTMTEFLILLDTRGSILTANRATAEALGYESNELKGKSMALLFEKRNHKAETLMKMITGMRAKNYEAELKTKTGKDIPDIISSSKVRDENKNVAGVVCIARDITELKRADEERNMLIEELQDSLNKIQTLKGLLPICARCKKIRDDEGYWSEVESYVQKYIDVQFSHGLCPECAKKEIEIIKKILDKKKKKKDK